MERRRTIVRDLGRRARAFFILHSSFYIAVAALCAATAGCTAVRVSHAGKSMVDVENNGWLLFNFIPLACGDTDHPESRVCKLFQNSVTLDNNIDLIDYAVRREGAVGVRDLVSYTTDEYVLFILLKRHSMHTSAELVMPDAAAQVGDMQRIDSKKLRDPSGAEVNTGDPDTHPARRTRPAFDAERPPETPKLRLLNF